MIKKKLCFLASFLFILSFITAGCSGTAAKSGTLTVGVRDDIMNFSYLNEMTEQYYGLEIDLAYELADRLGYESVEFVPVTASDRKEILQNGDVDCLIAIYSIADSRMENFDFTEPYYTDQTGLIVETSSLIDDVQDLKDRRIGILNGANSGALLAQGFYDLGIITDEVLSNTDTETLYSNLTVLKYPSYQELFQALEEGDVDAACTDGCIASGYMQDTEKFLDVSLGEQQYGVATQKDSELSSQIADAMQNILEDGTMEQIIDKWD